MKKKEIIEKYWFLGVILVTFEEVKGYLRRSKGMTLFGKFWLYLFFPLLLMVLLLLMVFLGAIAGVIQIFVFCVNTFMGWMFIDEKKEK